MRTLLATLPLVIAGLACSSPAAETTAPEQSSPASSATSTPVSSSPSSSSGAITRVPRLKVGKLVSGLDIPWDVQQVRGGLLVTERDSAQLLRVKDGRTRRIAFPGNSVWVSGETGLMSMAVDPAFNRNRRVFVCQGGFTDSGTDVRVVSYRLDAALTRASKPRIVLSGLPVSSGRHGGCRLLIDRETGALHVGTGDAAIGTNPRDLTSLGGKTLRLDRKTGAPGRATRSSTPTTSGSASS